MKSFFGAVGNEKTSNVQNKYDIQKVRFEVLYLTTATHDVVSAIISSFGSYNLGRRVSVILCRLLIVYTNHHDALYVVWDRSFQIAQLVPLHCVTT